MSQKLYSDLPLEIICYIITFIRLPRDIQNLFFIDRRTNVAANKLAWEQATELRVSCLFADNSWNVFLTVNGFKINRLNSLSLLPKLGKLRKIWLSFRSTQYRVSTAALESGFICQCNKRILDMLIKWQRIFMLTDQLKFLCVNFLVRYLMI
jgi:hypothetical protein